ncbi:type I-C CRISPR-associated endonuclease Cas1c [Candidatus Arthromitus sp. SFB-rat-Yit]|uniref:type I-C CRISPR-associated endonuclease Cas1c n=1 Tax=Candidatus Arthromitus sp. SFB-rat-Yit TaxID=1041504 RepID=UPI000227A75E|nr:type I-C CRISPR-associated endonuclease Cas1c [Candidatus Arthromitus sp. SFB-rat-Yit]BAK81142.1 CRISPR-associated Cas1 family protein [Candidatus Arthromitus sp. SFB-rat-Yit]
MILIGYQGASTKLMAMCAEKNIGMSFCTPYGKFLCRVQGKVSGNILLRKKQYRISDDEYKSCLIAKNFIIGKLINYRNVLNRFKRDYADKFNKNVKKSIEYLSDTIKSVSKCEDLDNLRGLEGIGSKFYFEVFNELILINDESFRFDSRNRRPPLDRVNALLSFVYVLLSHDMASSLESVGLDPQAGFLHRDRPGRNGLALDMMEELRPYLCDRFVLKLINTKVIKHNDFIVKENGSVLMLEDARKSVLTAWQKRKKDIIKHPFLGEKIEIGLIPYVQSLLLARYLRGDLEEYPPYLMK